MATRGIKAGDLITFKSSLLRFYNDGEPPIYLVVKTTRVRTRAWALLDIQKLGTSLVMKGIESDIYEVYHEGR
tara:strand:+ start:514 stop:732 length:219 start_codon:yes stop_codon:yes gene_type:complete